MRSSLNLIITLWAISLGAVSYLSLTPSIEFPVNFTKADLAYHFLAYFWISALPFLSFQRSKIALVSAIIMVPFGVSLESAQILVSGRFFSVTDLGANIFGVFWGAVCGRYLKFIFMRGKLYSKLSIRK